MAKTKSSSLIKLHKLPDVKFDEHAWVDFIELMCLLSPDQEVNQTDILERFRRGKELGEGVVPDSTEEEETDEHSVPEGSDKDLQWMHDLFAHLRYREEAFAASYPFTVSDDGSTLFVRKPLTVRQKSYLSLLLSANTGYVTKGASKLTSSFEIISKAAMKQLLPSAARVHVFGSNSAHRASRYQGTVLAKIRKLAHDLHENPKATESDFPPTSTGDEGLDVVGWVPFPDSAPGALLLFAQCACSKDDWVSKQSSSSPLAWSNKIDFTVRPSNVAFIPICFRKADGSWHKRTDIYESIIVDRLRLLHLLRDNINIFKRQRSYDVVQAAIRQREPVF